MKIVSHNQLEVDDEFIKICKLIEIDRKTDDEWSKIESSDMFQSEKYCGGYESIEQEFCFSYFAPEGREWWFQVSIEDVHKIVAGELRYLDLHEPL